MQKFFKLFFLLSSLLDGQRLLKILNKPIVMCISAALLGAVMSMGLAPIGKWPFTVIALVFFMVMLYKCEFKEQSFVLVFIFFGTYSTLSLTWLNFVMEGFGQVPMILSYIIIVAFSFCYIGIPYAVTTLIFYIFSSKKRASFILCFVPVAFALGDYLISVLLTGFPWVYPGYACVEGPLKNFAPFVGIRGINLILYILCGALALTALRKFLFLPIAGIILAVGILLENIPQVQKLPPINASLVQANITQSVHNNAASINEIFGSYWNLTKPNMSSADLVVWSESALPVDYYSSAELVNDLDTVFKNDKTALITGIFSIAQGKVYNSMVHLGNGASLEKDLPYLKRKLVPFGEFVPFEKYLRPIGSIFVIPNSSFSFGPEIQEPFKINDRKFIPAICYEAIFPGIIADLDAADTNGIVMISNDTWFGPTQAPEQHLNIARMRAMELQKPMLRCTNSGITAYIDEMGNVIERLPSDKEAVLNVKFTPVEGQTVYSKYGNFGFFLIMMLLIFLGIYDLKRKNDPLKDTLNRIVRP